MDKNIKKYIPKMHCASCEILIKEAAVNAGAKNIVVNGEEKSLSFTGGKIKIIEDNLRECGYECFDEKPDMRLKNETVLAFLIAASVIGVLVILEKLGWIRTADFEHITLPVVFGIGVVASLSSCMAVTGGLLLSLNSLFPESRKRVLVQFLLSRTFGFGILGGMIGLLGSRLVVGANLQIWLQIGLGIIMLMLGLNSLGWSRAINLPNWAGDIVLKWKNGQKKWWLPIILGIATFILPCGFTQSMQLYALSLHNPVSSALTMLVFALGTLPVLISMSLLSIKLNQGKIGEVFFKTIGFLLVTFGVWQIWVGSRGI